MTIGHALSRTQENSSKTPHPSVEPVSLSSRAPSKMRHAEATTSHGWFRVEADSGADSRTQDEHATSSWTLDSVHPAPQPSPSLPDVREHINTLLALGWSLPLIAKEISVPVKDLHALKAGQEIPPGVRRLVETFPLGCNDTQKKAPALGAWRRTQALTAMGWSLKRQSHELGFAPRRLEALKDAKLISAKEWRAIDGLYDKWSMSLGPDTTVMEQARAAGVTPPLGWDDDELDHPDALDLSNTQEHSSNIDPNVIERRLSGDVSVPLNRTERAELIQIAIDKEIPFDRIADILGIERPSLMRTLRRWGIYFPKNDTASSSEAHAEIVDQSTTDDQNGEATDTVLEVDSSDSDDSAWQLSLWGPAEATNKATVEPPAPTARPHPHPRRCARPTTMARNRTAWQYTATPMIDLDIMSSVMPAGP